MTWRCLSRRWDATSTCWKLRISSSGPRLRGEPHQAADQIPQALLGRHRGGAASHPGGGAPRGTSGELGASRSADLAGRTAIGEEVDFVIEAGDRLLPIEVKATERPRLRDIAHLRTFRAEYGDRARAGLLLHAGNTLEWLAPDVLAAPGGGCYEASSGGDGSKVIRVLDIRSHRGPPGWRQVY